MKFAYIGGYQFNYAAANRLLVNFLYYFRFATSCAGRTKLLKSTRYPGIKSLRQVPNQLLLLSMITYIFSVGLWP